MALYAKLWTDILADPKLMRAARKGAKHLVVLPWLIAFAKAAQDHGRLTVNGEPAEPIDIAGQIPGATAGQVAQCLTALLELGVLVAEADGALVFANWERRSGQGRPSDTPDAVAERVRRHRARHRAGNAEAVTDGNDVTVTRGNAGEIEREIEQDQEQEQDSVSQSGVGATRVHAALPTAADRQHLDTLLASTPSPAPWLAEMQAALDGMPGHRAVTPAQLATAIADYVGNGDSGRPNLAHFRGYLRRAAAPERATTPHPRRGASPGAQMVANIIGPRSA